MPGPRPHPPPRTRCTRASAAASNWQKHRKTRLSLRNDMIKKGKGWNTRSGCRSVRLPGLEPPAEWVKSAGSQRTRHHGIHRSAGRTGGENGWDHVAVKGVDFLSTDLSKPSQDAKKIPLPARNFFKILRLTVF